MTKKKAIKILRAQIAKLDDANNWNNIWTIETNTYLSKFFGDESKEANFINNGFWIENKVVGTVPKKSAEKSKKFLLGCIGLIENFGIHKTPKGNFLSRLSDRMVIFIISLIFSIGIVVGRFFYHFLQSSS